MKAEIFTAINWDSGISEFKPWENLESIIVKEVALLIIQKIIEATLVIILSWWLS